MSGLLFCALSDLHLGEEDSLLTNLELGRPVVKPRSPNRCTRALINLLHAIKRVLNQGKPIPRLILLGDVVELAQAPFDTASASFRTLLFLFSQRRLADKVVYIPGNHDHGLWSLGRNTAWLERLCTMSFGPMEQNLDYTTGLSNPVRISALERLGVKFPEFEPDTRLLAAYPNYRLQAGSGHDFIFTHGHFMEDAFKLMSIMARRLMENIRTDKLAKVPRKTLEELEKDNSAWIDFIWSGIASSGRSGEVFERVYEAVMVRDREVSALLDRVSEVLKQEYDIPYLMEAWEDDAFRAVLKGILNKTGYIGSHHRRSSRASAFTKGMKSEIAAYLTAYVKSQLADEGDVPSRNETTFIHGHTHKPYFAKMKVKGFGSVTSINTGGWVVETKKTSKSDPRRPAVVLGDDKGGVFLLTFNRGHKVELECESSNKMEASRIRESLSPWAYELGRKLVESLAVREEYLSRRMEKFRKNLGT